MADELSDAQMADSPPPPPPPRESGELSAGPAPPLPEYDAVGERAGERRQADPAHGCKWVLSKGEREGACGRVVGSTVLCRFVDFGGDTPMIPIEKRMLAGTEPVDLSNVGQAVSLCKNGVMTGGRIEACGVGRFLVKLDDTGGSEWHPHAAAKISTKIDSGVWIS